jgi:hypothetical protein
MLIDTLSRIGYNDFYEDANLIGHRYFGWIPPDVSKLEEVIMSDYDKTQMIYNILPKERTSSMGTQIRLYKQLELRGHYCTIEDFKVVNMRESIEFADAVWKEMCEGCNDPEIYFIPTL